MIVSFLEPPSLVLWRLNELNVSWRVDRGLRWGRKWVQGQNFWLLSSLGALRVGYLDCKFYLLSGIDKKGNVLRRKSQSRVLRAEDFVNFMIKECFRCNLALDEK